MRGLSGKTSLMGIPLTTILAVIGLSLTWFVTYTFAYSYVFTPLDTFSTIQANSSRVLYLGGIAGAQALLYRLSPRLVGRSFRVPLAVLASLFLLVLPGSLLSPFRIVEINSWAVSLSLPLAGMWQGVFNILWSEAAMRVGSSYDQRVVFGSIMLGAILFAGSHAFFSEVIVFVVFLSIIGNLGVYVLHEKSKPRVQDCGRAISRRLAKGMRKGTVTVTILGSVFGVGIYACMTTGSLSVSSYATIGLALATGAAAMLLLNVMGSKSYKIEEIALALSPVIAVLLVLFIYLENPLTWAAYLILLAVLTALDGTAFCFQMCVTRELGLNPFMSISRGRMHLQLGMFLAASANYVFVLAAEQSGVDSPPLLVPLVLVAFLFVAMSTANSETFLPVGSLNPPPRESVEAVSELSTERPTPVPVEAVSSEEMVVQQIAEDYELSAREVDVLKLIICGNSTPAIAEKLFISSNTVKSHRYHIFRKMGVNSKQELVDIRDQYQEQLACQVKP